MPRITSADRAEEMNRLIVEQGTFVRHVQYLGREMTDEEQALSNARADRMHELVELLQCHVNAPGYQGEEITPGRYINDRISAWLKMNPLALTNQRMYELLKENRKTNNPNTGNICGVTIQIGEGEKAYHYTVMADDFVALRGGGRVLFRVPESIAEHFRQQGVRMKQRALQRELGL